VVIVERNPAKYVTRMVTTIHKGAKRRLFLREHREAKGISAPVMAGRMGMERESLLRLEREWKRCNAEKQARFAAGLDIDPEDLWRLPAPKEDTGMDAKIDTMRKMIEDLQNMIKKTGS
jgi:transcriptional regulator with XRE-family HTH domain